MRMLSSSSDAEIRVALRTKYLRHERSRADTLIVDELGLAHAKSRVDLAVINGFIHGYEIKSAKDNLDRLGTQIHVYRQTLQKLTVVAARRHVAEVLDRVPDWCGVLEVKQGPRGGISFDECREASLNPDVDPVMLAHLLWRPEVVQILHGLGYENRALRQPRLELYRMLCQSVSVDELTSFIGSFMSRRSTWRGHPVPASCGD